MKIASKLSKILLLTFFMNTAFAVDSSNGGSIFDDLGLNNQDDILEVDEAFQLTTDIKHNQFEAYWLIAEGHYLYRDKFEITVNDTVINTKNILIPSGEEKMDPIFNKKLFVFHNNAEAILPFQSLKDGDKETIFKVTYQGCSETAGICYPPETKNISVTIPFISNANAASTKTSSPAEEMVSEQDQLAGSLKSDNTAWTLLIFFGAGLLLAFTPCVFPMVPILSGIIIGQGEKMTTRKAFTLSVVYVLAMAATYTVVGVLIGLSGANIQAWFQNPWVIVPFASLFVALSFSMFGFYELQMPASVQNRLIAISNSQQGGTLIGVAIMGFLSALIVGPCVTAPLVAALIFIADTGDAVLGGLALFSLGMGMGVPLIILGTTEGKMLPKAGTWMDAVKAAFGVMLLGLAIWLLERVTPTVITMAMWGALLIVSAIYMGAIDSLPSGSSGWRKFWKGIGLLFLIYGVVILLGLASGGRNVFQPLQNFSTSNHSINTQTEHLQFRQIKGVSGLNVALTDAKKNNQNVMLDFYADWCVSCKEMEVYTFGDANVQAALKGVMLLQADVTPDDEQDKALYERFGIIGPPSIMFFDKNGIEKKNFRVVGFMSPEKFSKHVKKAFK